MYGPRKDSNIRKGERVENETLEDLKLKEVKSYDKRSIQKIESFSTTKMRKEED